MSLALRDLTDGPSMLFRRTLAEAGSENLRAWRAKRDGVSYRVYLSRDPYGHLEGGEPDWRWHISVSHFDGSTDRVPAWAALVAIAHDVRPGVPMVVGVPPRSMWMNVHGGVLHLVETRDHNLVEQWRHEAKGHVPT